MKPSKDFKYALIVFIACLALMLVSMMACNPNGTSIFPEDDPFWTHHTDTIPITPEPLFNDSCQSFTPITDPPFFSFEVHPDTPFDHWEYWGSSVIVINIDTFFAQYGGSSHTYYSGINIGGIVTGILKKQAFTQVYAVDIFGQRYQAFRPEDNHNRALSNYGMIFGGALTFDQFWIELQTHQSLQIINFRNTGYTCEQIEQVLNFLIENCKAGPSIVDLRPISIGTCIINPDLIAAIKLSGSTVWQ